MHICGIRTWLTKEGWLWVPGQAGPHSQCVSKWNFNFTEEWRKLLCVRAYDCISLTGPTMSCIRTWNQHEPSKFLRTKDNFSRLSPWLMLRWAEFKVACYSALLGSQREVFCLFFVFTYLELDIYKIISTNNKNLQGRAQSPMTEVIFLEKSLHNRTVSRLTGQMNSRFSGKKDTSVKFLKKPVIDGGSIYKLKSQYKNKIYMCGSWAHGLGKVQKKNSGFTSLDLLPPCDQTSFKESLWTQASETFKHTERRM